MESQGVHFEGEVHGRPIAVGDILELDENIGKAYEFLHECDEHAKEYLKPILDYACDVVCSMCFELGFENPAEVCGSLYYFCVIDNRNK